MTHSEHGTAASRLRPGGGSNGGKQQEDYLTTVSKEMANKLRHDPPEGMDGCGFVPVTVLTEKMDTSPSPEQVVHIAKTDEKGRYQLDDTSGDEAAGVRVRATQGHSVPLENPLVDPIHAPHEVPLALHATSEESWRHIRECGELRRMHRTHIHFASEPKHLRGNDWASVLLKVDLERAIRDGIQFCKAANGVVLCEGPIPLRYIQRVRLSELPQYWQDEAPNKHVGER